MRALSNHSMHQPVATHAPRSVPSMAAGKACGRQRAQVTTAAVESAGASRRQWLLASTTSALLLAAQGLAPQPGLSTSAIEIINDAEGFGKRAARKGDLLLLHYVGTIKETGAVFDSTRGGLTYRDGGPGTNRPVIIRLGGDPVPGVCAGLKAGLEGMRIGGKRTFVVPPELGFRGSVLAPYALVPEGSALTYDVELIRLSARGPDELTKGIDRCGQGGAAQQVANCGDIEPAEFLINFPVDYQLQVSGNEDNS